MPQRHAIVFRRKRAPQNGVQPKNTEVRPRNQFGIHVFRLPAKREAHRDRKAAKHSGKHFVVRLEVTEHRMRNRVSAPIVPVMVPPHRQQNQLLRIFYRQQPQEDLIQKRKNRRVCPDSERQRHHRYGHIARASPKRAPGKLEIADRRTCPLIEAHQKPSARICRSLCSRALPSRAFRRLLWSLRDFRA